MAFYYTGTATGPGAGDALMQAMNTNLLAGGWTAVDIISSSTGTRDVVYKGSALDSTAGNAPYIRITQTSTTNIAFRCYQDWDTTTHVGINEAGNGSASPSITVTDASFVYFMRINPVALFVCAKNSSNYNKAYVGFLRRGLGLSRSGCTKTTGTSTSGTATINVASDLTTKLKVGQTIQIVNYAHSSASANAAKVEKKVIQSISSSSITFTANLTNSYDTGALVGENVLPVCVTAVNGAGGMSTMYFPTQIDGTRTTNIGQTINPVEVAFNSTTQNSPSTGWGEYASGVYDISSGQTGTAGFRGWFYHLECVTKGVQSLEDVMTDGDNTFIVLGLGTGLAVCVGPQN
jgi:hypothetical protein